MIIIHVLIVTFFDHGDGRLHIREKFSLMVRVIYSEVIPKLIITPVTSMEWSVFGDMMKE